MVFTAQTSPPDSPPDSPQDAIIESARSFVRGTKAGETAPKVTTILAVEYAQAILDMQKEIKRLEKRWGEEAMLHMEDHGRADDAEAQVTALRTALDKVDSQAACMNMDGDEGNARMLLEIYNIADAALKATTPPVDSNVQASTPRTEPAEKASDG